MPDASRAAFQTIHVLTRVIDARDTYTSDHHDKVAMLARRIAQELRLSRNRIEAVRVGAMLHDIGKMRVPAEILAKPGKLHETEFALVRMHPAWGHELLDGIKFPWPVQTVIRQHHERLDGSGYPDGIANGAILLEAQIVAVADIVDSMASPRPYRAALGLGAAVDELKQLREKHLDGDAVDAGIAVLEADTFGYPA